VHAAPFRQKIASVVKKRHENSKCRNRERSDRLADARLCLGGVFFSFLGLKKKENPSLFLRGLFWDFPSWQKAFVHWGFSQLSIFTSYHLIKKKKPVSVLLVIAEEFFPLLFLA